MSCPAAEGQASDAVSQYSLTDRPLVEALKAAGQGVEVRLNVDINGKTYQAALEHHEHEHGHEH